MTQSEILLGCTHAPKTSEVRTNGKDIRVCSECWNASVYARRNAMKAAVQLAKNEGADYWHSRGIKVGEKVFRLVQSMLGSAMRVEGVAKTGARGAYVQSSFQKGFLAPGGWSK